MSSVSVGSFPFKPGMNPYQSLITGAMEEAGLEVFRIPPQKWFPLQKAFSANCDILHLDWPHDWYSGKNGVTRWLKRSMYLNALRKKKELLGNTKLVWTAHNLIAHDSNDIDDEHRMIQALIDQCDGIMVMSEAAKNELRQRYRISAGTSVKKIFHGHYINCYPNSFSREAARKQLGIGSDEMVFLSLGSIKPYKGHLKLVRTFASIADQQMRLVIGGSCNRNEFADSLAEEVNKQSIVSSRIDLHLKLIEDDELQVFFNAADVCVLPFESILNSGSLLLAMSFGIPVLAPATGSIPEVAIPEFVTLYDPAEPTGLANGMRAIAGKLNRVECRKDYIEMTRQKYCWSKIGHSLLDWYSKLIT